MYSSYFFNDASPTEIYTLSLHDALPISIGKHTKSHRTASGDHLARWIGGDYRGTGNHLQSSERGGRRWQSCDFWCACQWRSEERRVGKECRSRWETHH